MIESLLGVLEQGLLLLNTKQSRKYHELVIKYKKEWYETYNASRVNHAKLDYIELQLRLISVAFTSEAARANARPSANP